MVAFVLAFDVRGFNFLENCLYEKLHISAAISAVIMNAEGAGIAVDGYETARWTIHMMFVGGSAAIMRGDEDQ